MTFDTFVDGYWIPFFNYVGPVLQCLLLLYSGICLVLWFFKRYTVLKRLVDEDLLMLQIGMTFCAFLCALIQFIVDPHKWSKPGEFSPFGFITSLEAIVVLVILGLIVVFGGLGWLRDKIKPM